MEFVPAELRDLSVLIGQSESSESPGSIPRKHCTTCELNPKKPKALLMVCTFHSSLDMHDAAHTMMISDIATSAWLIDFCHKAIKP